jgi:hypothetical protein
VPDFEVALGNAGVRCVNDYLRATHEEHGSRMHAEHPQLRGNAQQIRNENGHLGAQL